MVNLPPSPSLYLSAGFKAGHPTRALLDFAAALYGKNWLASPAAQGAVVDQIFGGKDRFYYGRRRESAFLRLLMDSVDRVADGEVDETLTLAIVQRTLSDAEGTGFYHVEVDRIRLRLSEAFSDIGSKYNVPTLSVQRTKRPDFRFLSAPLGGRRRSLRVSENRL